jgi:hypothetical protein
MVMVRRLFCLSAGLAVATSALAQQVIEPTETQDMQGLRLIGDQIGAGRVEHMDVVMEREREWLATGQRHSNKNSTNGAWVVPSSNALYHPKSGSNYITNKWGDTQMGIGFPHEVDVHGAWFAGQGGGEGAFAQGVRAIGYRDGEVVATTDWFKTIGKTPMFFAMGLENVDRIQIEAIAAEGGGGWYAMDDFAFGPVGSELGDQLTTLLTFEDLETRSKLTGSGYGGLTWETGTGDYFDTNAGIHAPLTIDGEEEAVLEAFDRQTLTERGGSGTSPLLTLDFDAVHRTEAGQGSWPPDTNGAVGPDHYMVTVNTIVGIFSKVNGNQASVFSLSSFLPGSSGDPRILYDQYEDRWVVMATDFSNQIFIAVSETNSPTGNWFKFDYFTNTGTDSTCWPDFPTLGLDQDGYYVSANMFPNTGSFCGPTVAAIEKAPLLPAGSQAVGAITLFQSISGFTLQPVHTHGNSNSDREYIISEANNTTLTIMRVNDPITSPTITTITNHTVASAPSPADSPALGASTDLDSGDNRLGQAVYRGGSLWVAQGTQVNNRAAIRWYEIAVSPSSAVTQQTGTIDDPSLHYYYPSISVNANEDAVLGFTGSNSSTSPGCYYAGRSGLDSNNVMSTPVLYRAGSGSNYNLVDGFGRNRWGDYSSTSLDPSDESFWTLQEYVRSSNVWGTHAAKLEYNPSGPASFALLTPADSASGIPENAFFQWAASAGVVSYTLEVDDDPGFSSPEISQATGLTSYSAPFGPLGPSQAYYWRVTATNPFGNTISTPASRTFSTAGPAPASPILVTPVPGNTETTDEVLFRWTEVALASTYTLEVDDNAGFGSPEINMTNIPPSGGGVIEVTAAAGILQDATTYNWRATAINPNGSAVSTPTSQSFDIDLGGGSCDGDANGDQAVDVNDISYVLFRLGQSNGVCGDGDANGDGVNDVNDISYVLFRLGTCNAGGPCP